MPHRRAEKLAVGLGWGQGSSFALIARGRVERMVGQHAPVLKQSEPIERSVPVAHGHEIRSLVILLDGLSAVAVDAFERFGHQVTQ